MVKYAEKNVLGRLDPMELTRFEASLGSRLPEEYRNFLLENNGCRFAEQMLFTITGPVQEALIDSLYGLDGANPYITITGALDIYAGRIPSTLLPIGSTIGDNLVCLSLVEKDYGAVYYWDHEGENVGRKPTFRNVFPVAPSLTAFLDSLQVYEPPAPEPSPETIFDACREGDLTRLKAYYQAGGDIGACNEYGMTLLRTAVHADQEAVVHWLVEHGAPIAGGISVAARFNRTSILHYLVENGADVNEQLEVYGNATPLIMSVEGVKVDKATVELLLEHGADVNAGQQSGRMALTRAMEFQHYDVAEMLLERGANPNVGSPLNTSSSPISMAVTSGNIQLLELLLAHGATLAGSGCAVEPSLLGSAAINQHVEMVQYLLDRGADPKVRTPCGTPLQDAKRSKNPEVIALIEAAIKRK